ASWWSPRSDSRSKSRACRSACRWSRWWEGRPWPSGFSQPCRRCSLWRLRCDTRAGVGVGSFDLFEVARPPSPVEGSLGRAVEAQDREKASPGNAGKPVGLLARRSLGSDVDVDATVGVLGRLIARAERGEGLAVGEAGSVFGLVECHRPEVGDGDIGGKDQF